MPPSATAHFQLPLPRHCYSPREVPRAADLWRVAQQAAVQDSARRGWPPERYLQARTGFVIYGVTAAHLRPPRYGQEITARTWIATFRRGIISRREVRVFADGELVSALSQDWAHVSADLTPTRAPEALLGAFAPTELRDGAEPALPARQPAAGPVFEARFTCWHSRVDPNDHANHPRYLDWADETVARQVVAAGGDPHCLAPVAEQLRWKSGFRGGEPILARSQLVGVTAEGHAVIECWLGGPDGQRRASATLVRRLVGGDLAALLGAAG